MLYICMDNSGNSSYSSNYDGFIVSKLIYWSYTVYSKHSQFGSYYTTVMGTDGGQKYQL